MDIRHRLNRWFKPRFAIIYPFGFFFLFFCGLNAATFRAGICFIIAGMLIRIWSNGYAIKNDKLTACGPYAYVRNPLYLGTFLIAIGFVIVLKSQPPLLEWSMGVLFLSALGFMYYYTIKGEQVLLLKKFRKSYRDYYRKVPAMWPCLVAYNKGEKWPFSMERFGKSKEYKTVFWIFILLVVFYIKTRLFIEHKGLNDRSWNLIVIALFLIILDAAYEFKKKSS